LARSESLGWHFTHAGRRIWAATKAEARSLAKEIADRTGRAVTVHPVKPKTRPARKVMTRNPDPGSIIDVLMQLERGKAARREYVAKTKGTRLAKSLTRRGRASELEAGARKSGKFVVDAVNKRDRLTLYRPSRSAADQLADQLRAAGYTATVKPA
jgi:hypothetical protein